MIELEKKGLGSLTVRSERVGEQVLYISTIHRPVDITYHPEEERDLWRQSLGFSTYRSEQQVGEGVHHPDGDYRV
jgi:hypothetical protein